MGNPKQKWTSEEEEALKAGVNKHGTGKWKDIQKDPEFNPFLSSRSNIDLKDKWRNMSVGNNGPREKSRVPRGRANPDAPAPSVSIPQTSVPVAPPTPSVSVPQTSVPAAPAAPSAPAALRAPTALRAPAASAPIRRDAPAATPIRRDPPPAAAPIRRDAAEAPLADSSVGLSDAIPAPMYNAMIFEALSASTDPNGLDTNAIASFIEQRNEVPANFRRSLTGRLRRLTTQEKLEKVQNCYKVKTDSVSGTKAPTPKPKEIIQPRQLQNPGFVTRSDAAEVPEENDARTIAEAENKQLWAAEAVREWERVSQMAADQEAMLQLAKDIFERCSEGEVFFMA